MAIDFQSSATIDYARRRKTGLPADAHPRLSEGAAPGDAVPVARCRPPGDAGEALGTGHPGPKSPGTPAGPPERPWTVPLFCRCIIMLRLECGFSGRERGCTEILHDRHKIRHPKKKMQGRAVIARLRAFAFFGPLRTGGKRKKNRPRGGENGPKGGFDMQAGRYIAKAPRNAPGGLYGLDDAVIVTGSFPPRGAWIEIRAQSRTKRRYLRPRP
jgi:hypothetical protein